MLRLASNTRTFVVHVAGGVWNKQILGLCGHRIIRLLFSVTVA